MDKPVTKGFKMFSLPTLMERGFDIQGFSEAVREGDSINVISKHPENFMSTKEQEEYSEFCLNIVPILKHWEREFTTSSENPMFGKN